MKKIVLVMLAIFPLFALTSNVFAKSPKFDKILFFESSKDGKEVSEYRTEFPKSKTRFVYAFVILRDDCNPPLMYRYYGPEGSLFWEEKLTWDHILLDPDDDYHWYGSVGCGWEQPGNWPVGIFTVKVWMEEGNFLLGQGSFKIYEDRDPIEIGKKVAMSGELNQTKKEDPYWIERSSSSSATHSFRIVAYVNKNWVIFFEMPKTKDGDTVMWVSDSSSNPYKKRVTTSDNKKKSYEPVTKSEFEQAAWRILKHFGY